MKAIPVRSITTASSETVVPGRFRIRSLADILKGADLRHELHRHDFYFILAIENGRGEHVIDFTNHDVGNCSIFVIRPGQVHELYLEGYSTGFLAEFDKAFYFPKETAAQQRLLRAGMKNACVFETMRFRKMYELLASMLAESSAREMGYLDVIRCDLDIFFIEYNRQTTDTRNIGKSSGIYAQERFEELMQLMSIHILTHKQVSQYAGFMNLSPYQLNSISREVAGKPVSEIINEQIILEAKRYLLATSSQVKDIADHLGYVDPSYFIRFFKKQTGYSPDAFRKNLR